jgi:WD40 repeat protein
MSTDNTQNTDKPTEIAPGSEEEVRDKSATTVKRSMLLDVRSDIYCLGATLYHLITGRKPAKHAKDVIPVSYVECSPGLANIVNKAMQPEPAKRFQSATEMLTAFRRLHENDPRMRSFRRSVYIASSMLLAFMLVGAASTYIGLHQMELIQTWNSYAEYSANALSDGNVSLAVSDALAALPQESDALSPGVLPVAQKALTDALDVYDLADGFYPSDTLALPSAPFKVVISPDGKTAAAVYAYKLDIINTQTVGISKSLPVVESALSDVAFLDNETLVYAGADGLTEYNCATGQIVWIGQPVTEIAISADHSMIAGVYKDNTKAVLYKTTGELVKTIDFHDKHQRIVANDIFANPNDNLLALNNDGKWLMVSYSDGSLSLFDTATGDEIQLEVPSDKTHFEGGFFGQYLAYSMTGKDSSYFMTFDLDNMTFVKKGCMESERRFGAFVDESGIYLSSSGTVVKFDPVSQEQSEVVYLDSEVTNFFVDTNYVIVSTQDNKVTFFDRNKNVVSQYDENYAQNFICLRNEVGVTGSRDDPTLKIYSFKDRSRASLISYDSSYAHDEARVNSALTRVMLFSFKGFRLYDMDGKIIADQTLPEPELVYDQQYCHASGNLVIIYPHELRIYSGEDGSLMLEKTDLKSVSYTKYGVSILEQDGTLSLVDMDTTAVIQSTHIAGEFGAFCGMAVDDSFLDGRTFIGAGKFNNEYYFAVSDGVSGAVYNSKGKHMFDIAITGKECEALFAGSVVVVSPLHGTPVVYSLSSRKKIKELQADAYLTYVTAIDKYLITEYITSDGERYGVLLDTDDYAPIANLPLLTDIVNGQLIFDYREGTLRKTHIYTINELVNLSKTLSTTN